MNKLIFNLWVILFIAISCTSKVKVKSPVAKKIAKELTIHGDTRIDNYYWMNDRENPDVIAHLEAENAYQVYTKRRSYPSFRKNYEAFAWNPGRKRCESIL